MAEGNSDKVAPDIKRLCRLISQRCALLVCDMQEKFRPAILHFDEIVKNTSRIGEMINTIMFWRWFFSPVESCKLLGVPILVTEQYPKGLGPTVDEIGIKVSEAAKDLKLIGYTCRASYQSARHASQWQFHRLLTSWKPNTPRYWEYGL